MRAYFEPDEFVDPGRTDRFGCIDRDKRRKVHTYGVQCRRIVKLSLQFFRFACSVRYRLIIMCNRVPTVH